MNGHSLLCRVSPLLLILALSHPGLAAQSPVPRDSQMAAAVELSPPRYSVIERVDREVMAADSDSTVHHYEAGEWKHGAIFGGLTFGLLGGYLGTRLCGVGDSNPGPVACFLTGFVASGAFGALIGGLIGSGIPKPQ